MSKKINLIAVWLFLPVLAFSVFIITAIPVWLIQPFAPQSENALQLSFLLKSWSPILTIIFALAAIGLAVFIWKNSKRWYGKVALIIPLLIIFVFSWFARQNHFEWMFNPLENTKFAKVSETSFVADDDMVLAVKINGDAVAFPIRQMAYHHIAQDVVGGTPITATY